MTLDDRHPLSARFDRFAEECARLNSSLYEMLSRRIAADAPLLDIAAHAAREPVPNLFLGAVHYLLLKNGDPELQNRYDSYRDDGSDDDALFCSFRAFAFRARPALIKLVSTRLVQTNEINRSAVLAPALQLAYQRGGRRPLALIEIGASAGLNLLWDGYLICFSDGTTLGDPQSTLRIDCENRGRSLRALSDDAPRIASRIGIDLNPVDLRDPDQRLWLRALVWPDHGGRAARLEAAIALATPRLPALVRGDALQELSGLLAAVPDGGTPCVFHSSVLYQFTPAERHEFAAVLAQASVQQPIWQVSAENEEGLRVIAYCDGQLSDEQFLGAFDGHGRWIHWEG